MPIARLARSLAICGATALGGCATDGLLLNMGSPGPRTEVIPPAPAPEAIMACVGERLSRYRGDGPLEKPLVIEVAPYRNDVPATVQRGDAPSEVTTALEHLITRAGPGLAFKEGWRQARVGEPYRDPADRPDGHNMAALRINGSISFVESNAVSQSRSQSFNLFGVSFDFGGSASDGASLASITLTMSAVDPATRTGGMGMGSQVQIMFDRQTTADRSMAASYSVAALGYSNVRKRIYGYGPAVQLGLAIQLAEVISRSQGIPVTECLTPVAPTVDTKPLETKLLAFRRHMALDPTGAAMWLNQLRALHGRFAGNPASLDSSSMLPWDGAASVNAAMSADPALKQLAEKGAFETRWEQEMLYLWATLHRVPVATYKTGERWIAQVRAAFDQARQTQKPREPEPTTRPTKDPKRPRGSQ